MDGRRTDSLLLELIGDPVGSTLGADKDQGPVDAFRNGGGDLGLVELVDL